MYSFGGIIIKRRHKEDWDDAAEEGKKTGFKGKAVKFFLMMLVLASIGGILYFALFSDYFNIKVIEIQGASTVDASQLEKVADIPFGGNLFLQNYMGMEKRLKKKFSIIEQVRVKQRLPHTVVIEVAEKQPELVVLSENGYLLVDGNGEILDINDKLGQTSAPLLTGLQFGGEALTGQILVKTEVRTALEFLAEVPENRMNLVREITVEDAGIAIYPTGSYRVFIGENKEIVKKLNTLETMIRDSGLLGNTIDYIDISNPLKIILKTKEGIS